MKRIIVIIILAASVAATASAQSSIGGGYMQTTYNAVRDGVHASYAGNGAWAGINACLWLPVHGLYLESGAAWEYAVMAKNYVEGEAKAHYVTVPLRFRYEYQFTYDYSVFASAGPSVTYTLAYKETGLDTSVIPLAESRKLDFGAGVELGAKLFKHLQLKGGYRWGIMNLAAENADGASLRRNVLYAGIAYQF